MKNRAPGINTHWIQKLAKTSPLQSMSYRYQQQNMCYRYQQQCVTDINNKVCVMDISNRVRVPAISNKAEYRNITHFMKWYKSYWHKHIHTKKYLAHAKEILNSQYVQLHTKTWDSNSFMQKFLQKKRSANLLTSPCFTVEFQITHSGSTHHLSHWWKYI